MRANVLNYVRERELMHAGDRVCVAVSGGADSVALLRVLLELRAELGIVLAVAHFNHRLRGADSEADEAFAADLARQHGLEFFSGRADVGEHASSTKQSVEAAGRELRYRWLTRLADEQRLDCIATAHTLNDQAETVLLKFLRGAGTRGLAGIYPCLEVSSGSRVRIVRPLLGVTRDEVESYVTSLGQSWREDETNLDRRFTRNRVRQELLPLLEREYNPNLRQALSDAAELALAEEEYWRMKAESYLDVWHKEPGRLQIFDFLCLPAGLRIEPVAFQRHVLKHFLASRGLATDFYHIEAVRRCMTGKLTRVGLPNGWQANLDGDWLELLPPKELEAGSVNGYEKFLPVPGECSIPEAGVRLRAKIVPAEVAGDEAPGSLLRLTRFGQKLTIRNWLPGDRFHPARRGSEEKLKRLFAEQHIPAEQRSTWPVALQGGEIVWVKGFPVASSHAWAGTGDAVKIEVA